MTDDRSKPLIRAREAQAVEKTFSHPWNPKSQVTGTRLSQLAGLSRTGVSLVRIRAGKESFAYHSHQCEEEWIYILSGKGIAEIDGAEYDVGPGDFMGFATPSVAHHMRNPGPDDLVYLMGGESCEVEIADFPHLGKRMVRSKTGVEIFNTADARAFEGAKPE